MLFKICNNLFTSNVDFSKIIRYVKKFYCLIAIEKKKKKVTVTVVETLSGNYNIHNDHIPIQRWIQVIIQDWFRNNFTVRLKKKVQLLLYC